MLGWGIFGWVVGRGLRKERTKASLNERMLKRIDELERRKAARR